MTKPENKEEKDMLVYAFASDLLRVTKKIVAGNNLCEIAKVVHDDLERYRKSKEENIEALGKAIANYEGIE